MAPIFGKERPFYPLAVGPHRLSLIGVDGRKRGALVGLARLAGFELVLIGSAVSDGPQHPASYRLAGLKTGAASGLEAWEAVWLGDDAPYARLRFAGWPWRMGSVTELKATLRASVGPAEVDG